MKSAVVCVVLTIYVVHIAVVRSSGVNPSQGKTLQNGLVTKTVDKQDFRASKSGGIILSMANYLYQKVYDGAGTLYKIGEPTRKGVANKIDSSRQRLVTVKSILAQLELEGKKPEEKIDNVIDVLIKTQVKKLPVYISLTPLEENSKSRYFCASKGLLRDVTTIRKVRGKTKPIEGGGFESELDLKVEHLVLNYTIFYIHPKQLSVERRGYLLLQFSDNNVHIKLKIAKFSDIISSLTIHKQCVATILKAKVTDLKLDHATVHTDEENDPVASAISAIVTKNLRKRGDRIRNQVDERILANIHRDLHLQDDYVCKSKEIVNEVDARRISIEQKPISVKFRKICGTDFEIEPYEKPR